MSGCGVGIRVDKPADCGVIVPALQVVQPGFGVVDITAVAQRVDLSKGGGHASGGGQQSSPGVVGVLHHHGAGSIDDAHDIPLSIPQVVILGTVILDTNGSYSVIGEVQGVAPPGHLHQLGSQIVVLRYRAAYGLSGAQPIRVVGKADTRPGFAHALELPSMLPGIAPGAVGEHIADGVAGDGLAVVAGEQILPAAVPIGIADRTQTGAQGAGGVCVLLPAGDIAIDRGLPGSAVLPAFNTATVW